jgi:hypothetical protein
MREASRPSQQIGLNPNIIDDADFNQISNSIRQPPNRNEQKEPEEKMIERSSPKRPKAKKFKEIEKNPAREEIHIRPPRAAAQAANNRIRELAKSRNEPKPKQSKSQREPKPKEPEEVAQPVRRRAGQVAAERIAKQRTTSLINEFEAKSGETVRERTLDGLKKAFNKSKRFLGKADFGRKLE